MILNVHISVVLVLFILKYLCLPLDFQCTYISGASVVHSEEPVFTRDLNVHASVVLVFFILEHRCLRCDFKCTCISGVSVVLSRAPVFTP